MVSLHRRALAVRTKPNVPIVLVCTDRATREAITRSGVACFMPVYPTEKAAMKALGQLRRRTVRRADARLPANLTASASHVAWSASGSPRGRNPSSSRSRWWLSTCSWKTCWNTRQAFR